MEIKLKVTKVQVLRNSGSTDQIALTFEGPSSYTYKSDDVPGLNIRTTAGYAEEWLAKMWGIRKEDIEVIEW